MKVTLTCVVLVFSLGLFAQPKYDTSNPFGKDMNARSHGLFIGIGGTYTVPLVANDGLYVVDSIDYEINFSNKGKLGPYIEFGKWHILNYGFFHSFEYGLSYRQYNGVEEYVAQEVPDLMNGEPAGIGSSKFKSHYAHFNVFFNRAYKLSKLSFIQGSLGAHVGYRFINSNEYISDIPFETISRQEDDLTFHANFRISYATRVNRLYLIPFAQTAIFNFKELSLSEANLPYFNSKYRPIIFGMRVQWLHQKKNRECPKKGPKNKKAYKKSTSLFGKDVRSKQLNK